MKAKLLTLAALAWAGSAMAGDWERPVWDFDPQDFDMEAATKVAPTDGSFVFLYNEASQQFLCGSNACGTQASVKPIDEAVVFKLVYEGLQQDNTIKAWGLLNQRSDKLNKYLFFDGGDGKGGSFIDMGSQNGSNPDCHHWNIEKQDDGTYTIQIVQQSNNYRENCYFAWSGSADGIVTPGFDVVAADAKGSEYGMYWSFVEVPGYAAYAAKETLYNALVAVDKANDSYNLEIDLAAAEDVYNNPDATPEEINAVAKALNELWPAKKAPRDAIDNAEATIDECGVDIDLTEGQELFDNPDATPEEMYAAAEKLTKAATAAKMADALENATPEEPADVTFLIKNPDFSENTNANDQPGWDCTFNGWQKDRKDGPADGVQIVGPFVEQWVSHGNKLDNRYCRQTLAALPAGAYKLGADITALQQGDRNVELTGCNFFAQVGDSDKQIVSCSSQKESGDVPVHYTIDFMVFNDGTDVTIGFETVNTNANWIAFDNFTLQFLGTMESPELMQLNIEVAKGRAYVSQEVEPEEDVYGFHKFSGATEQAYEDLLQKAEAMNGSTPTEEVVALTEEIQAIHQQLLAEIEAYAKLIPLYTKAVKFSETCQVEGVPEALGNMVMDMDEKAPDGLYSIEDIEALLAQYDYIAHELAPKNVAEGDDLTIHIQNPDFENDSREGWIAPNGWTNVAAGCAEMWNKDFDVYQDIKNLPNGLYEVGLNGFYRQGGWDKAMVLRNNGEEHITAYVYGKSGNTIAKTPFKSIFDGMEPGETPLYTDGSDVVHNSDVEVEIDGVKGWIPDGMAGFAAYQEDGRYYFTAQLFVMDGNLRLGAMNEKHNEADWVIFDNFTLKYVSSNMVEPLTEFARNEIQELIKYRDQIAAKHPLPKLLHEGINNLDADLDAVVAADPDNDAINAFRDRLPVLEKQLAQADSAYYTLKFNYEYYAEAERLSAAGANSNDSEGFLDWIDSRKKCYADGYEYDKENPLFFWNTIDEMLAEDKEMRERWIRFVLDRNDIATATNEEPVDLSEVITSHNFPQYSDENGVFTTYTLGWEGATGTALQADKEGEQDYSEYALAYELFNKNYNMYQTIKGLPVGWYILETQGFYRMGGYEAAADSLAKGTYESFAMLYADVNGKVTKSPLKGIFESTEAVTGFDNNRYQEFAVTVKYDEDNTETYYIPNRLLAADQYFLDGCYAGNKVGFQVTDEESEVKLGVMKDSLLQYDWTCFTNFTLNYVGKSEPTGISTAASTAAVKQAFYTIGGLQVARPQKGVNIVVTTLSDGTKITSKVLVK